MGAVEQATVVAAQLFAEQGYSATTTREIADTLGVPKGTFYHHYPSKEHLLLQICEESLGRITAKAKGALDDAADPLGRLEAVIRAHLGSMLEDQALHTTMLTELRALSADNREQVIALRDAYGAILQSAIADCQQEGLLEPEPEAHLSALLLLNMLNWTIFWYRPDGQHAPESIADAVIKTVLEGWRPRSSGL